ncbi:MAG: four helix bundle protein [Putridiphycobacter sp.]|nr:four helix bundle protein [Putridiphycobacter sp.]
MHNFKELKVWGKAMVVVENTYAISKELPNAERFTSISQVTRSALSIPSNIAEGAGRDSDKDFKRFLNIAVGSSYELETQLILIEKIFKIETKDLIKQVTEVQSMLFSLTKSLK